MSLRFHLCQLTLITLFFTTSTVVAEPLSVVASFSILGDMVQQVGGEHVAVTTLVGPNGDTHMYQPTPAHVAAITQSRLVVMNGLGFEGWMSRLLQTSGYHGTVVVASNGVTPRQINGAPDPHAWQDLENGQRSVITITAALITADPAHEKTYRARSEAYLRTLQDTERWVHEQLAKIPREKRRVITTHDAFGYFGAAYGVTFLAPKGWNTESEPSAKDIAHIIGQIKKDHVRALFVENMTDPRLMQQIAHEAGAVIGGALYSDALAPPKQSGDSYLGLFQHNVAALMAAWNPTAP